VHGSRVLLETCSSEAGRQADRQTDAIDFVSLVAIRHTYLHRQSSQASQKPIGCTLCPIWHSEQAICPLFGSHT
jgi:hypothetical protein